MVLGSCGRGEKKQALEDVFLAFLAAGESASEEVTVSSLAKGSFIVIEFTPFSKSVSIHQKFLSEAPKEAMPMQIPSFQVLQRF